MCQPHRAVPVCNRSKATAPMAVSSLNSDARRAALRIRWCTHSSPPHTYFKNCADGIHRWYLWGLSGRPHRGPLSLCGQPHCIQRGQCWPWNCSSKALNPTVKTATVIAVVSFLQTDSEKNLDQRRRLSTGLDARRAALAAGHQASSVGRDRHRCSNHLGYSCLPAGIAHSQISWYKQAKPRA